jgi:FkbM family methyltransferase
MRLEIYPRTEKYYWLGTYERAVVEELSARLAPGNTFWDVGSHIGYIAAIASRLVGPTGSVVAFEPNPENVRRLRRTIELNHLHNVIVREVALSHQVGRSLFHVGDAPSMGSLQPNPTSKSSIPVWTETVDEELGRSPFPNLVKIDVEGSECAVLAGAVRLLQRRPPLIVEVWSSEQRQLAAQMLSGYTTSMLDGQNMLALSRPRGAEG